MRLCNLSPEKVKRFFEVVDMCNGKVELVTAEGDRLNLKSALCKYVALANILSTDVIPELQVVCYEPDDISKMISFMIEG